MSGLKKERKWKGKREEMERKERDFLLSDFG
jgi:hypothetical protein